MSKHYELMRDLEQSHGMPPVMLQGSHQIGMRGRSEHAIASNALKLAQQVFLAPSNGSPRMVVFTGVEHGNGCTQIAAAVAQTLAHEGKGSVCLVEANFRSPDFSSLFSDLSSEGLSDAILNQGPIKSFAKPRDVGNLWVLPCGTAVPDAPALLGTTRMGERISELRNVFSFIIVDAPPLTLYSDAIALARHADGVIMVLEAESTRREAAAVAAAELRSANVPILAAVLNKREFPIPERLYRVL